MLDYASLIQPTETSVLPVKTGIQAPYLAPDFEQGKFLIAEGPRLGDNDLLVEQILGLDNKTVADDGPDSLEMGH